jgi:hypothetical protein
MRRGTLFHLQINRILVLGLVTHIYMHPSTKVNPYQSFAGFGTGYIKSGSNPVSNGIMATRILLCHWCKSPARISYDTGYGVVVCKCPAAEEGIASSFDAPLNQTVPDLNLKYNKLNRERLPKRLNTVSRKFVVPPLTTARK